MGASNQTSGEKNQYDVAFLNRERGLTKHLALHALILVSVLHWYRYAPCQISRYGTWPQTLLQPRVDELTVAIDNRVRAPITLLPALLDPLFRARLDLVQGDVHMIAGFCDDLVCLVDKTARIDELDRIECTGADIALVATGVVGTTMRAGSFHETIRKEPDGSCQ